jgi:hypothetical protein
MLIPDAKFEEILNDVIKFFLIPKHKALGMEATGEWINSLESKSNVIRGRKYTEQLVYGRRKNDNQDPKEIRKWAVGVGSPGGYIYEWAKAKGVNIPPIAIAYKIAREGTTWKKKGGSDLLEVLETKEVIDYINKQIARYFQAEITLQIQRELQTI